MSIVVLSVVSACYSTIKHDEIQNRQDGEVSETDLEVGDYDESRFSINGSFGDVTVEDQVTGLIWQLDYQSEMTHRDALDYCSELESGGYRDWRLPNDSELLSIVDINNENTSNSFPNMSKEWFWTSSESISDNRFARFVRFDQGDVLLADKEKAYAARCARGNYKPN